MAEREKEMKRREEKLGSWSQEKASRKAAIKQFRNKLKRGWFNIKSTFLLKPSTLIQEPQRIVKQTWLDQIQLIPTGHKMGTSKQGRRASLILVKAKMIKDP